MTARKVLIVEDEAIVAMALSRALPRLGLEVCRVLASGEEALDFLNNQKPDLVLMDIHLLGALDGIQTAERIREHHELPIVFMTGYSISEIQEKTKHLANVAHVGKPVGISTLAQVIESTLGNSRA